jgi:hypothetical protein
MHMDVLRLARLETIQPDEQVLAQYEIDLGRLLPAEDRQSID